MSAGPFGCLNVGGHILNPPTFKPRTSNVLSRAAFSPPCRRVARSTHARLCTLHLRSAARPLPERSLASTLPAQRPFIWRCAEAIATKPTTYAEHHAAMTSFLLRAVNSGRCAPPHPLHPLPGGQLARVPLLCSGRPVPEHAVVASAACVRVSLPACWACFGLWLVPGGLRPCIPEPR